MSLNRRFPLFLLVRRVCRCGGRWVACLSAWLLAATVVLAAPPPLDVFAAASLKESLDEAAAAYARDSGQPVRVSYAGSSVLARQIEQGAPADVFISADLDWMDWLDERGQIDGATRSQLLGNQLVLIAPAAAALPAVRLVPGVDLRPLLGDGHMALALTASVPAGKYAKAALVSLGLWEQVQPQVAQADNVRAALLLVARGEAALGVVYASDALAELRVRVVAEFPADSHRPIIYPAAVLRRSTHPLARDFIAWLRQPAAAEIFRRRGFTMLG